MTEANYDDDDEDRTVVSCWLEGCQRPMPDTFQSTFAFTHAFIHNQVDHHLYSSHFCHNGNSNSYDYDPNLISLKLISLTSSTVWML